MDDGLLTQYNMFVWASSFRDGVELEVVGVLFLKLMDLP
jgi:hypothetical protein